MEPIIRSILDTDLYKLTMQQAVLDRYQSVPVTYNFIDRKPTDLMNAKFLSDLCTQIYMMRDLKLTNEEAHFLSGLGYFKPQYIDWLYRYQFDPNQVSLDLSHNRLSMTFKGTWDTSILWEVPILALTSELYFRHNPAEDTLEANQSRLEVKGKILSGLRFSEFGTRRRRSFEHQEQAVKVLKTVDGFQGTSNVHLARLYGGKPIGTMAHEWIMGISVLEGLRHANRFALRAWHDVYQGQLGIALTDTFGTDAFWKDFDHSLARVYDGVRHDSADPAVFTSRVIKEYIKKGIDPSGKKLIYSDGLTATKCRELSDKFDSSIQQSFGIGTHLTNDIPGSPALNIVVKLRTCNDVEVVKLSDEPGKATGDRDAMRIAKHIFFGNSLDAKEEIATK